MHVELPSTRELSRRYGSGDLKRDQIIQIENELISAMDSDMRDLVWNEPDTFRQLGDMTGQSEREQFGYELDDAA